MMVNIFYAGNNDEWDEYKVHIKNALDDLDIKYSMTRNPKNPLEIDYIVYAPNGPLKDFKPFKNVKLVQNLWAGVEVPISNKSLTQPLARMVEPGLTIGMADYNHYVFVNCAAPAALRFVILPYFCPLCCTHNLCHQRTCPDLSSLLGFYQLGSHIPSHYTICPCTPLLYYLTLTILAPTKQFLVPIRTNSHYHHKSNDYPIFHISS